MTPALPPGGLPITQVAAVVQDLDDGDGDATTRRSAGARGTCTSTSRLAAPHTAPRAEHRRTRCSAPRSRPARSCFELLQPLEGPSIYREWLDEHGEGLHHVAVMLHTLEESDALRRTLRANRGRGR